MGVAEGISGISSVSRNGLVVAGGDRSTSASRSDARLDKCDLLSAISNGPVAARLSNHFNLLEKRALVPLESNLKNFASFIEGHKVSNGEVNITGRQKIVIKAREIRTASSLKAETCVNF